MINLKFLENPIDPKNSVFAIMTDNGVIMVTKPDLKRLRLLIDVNLSETTELLVDTPDPINGC